MVSWPGKASDTQLWPTEEPLCGDKKERYLQWEERWQNWEHIRLFKYSLHSQHIYPTDETTMLGQQGTILDSCHKESEKDGKKEKK